jgi:hypothetical protein
MPLITRAHNSELIDDAFINSLPYGYFMETAGRKFTHITSNEAVSSQDGNFAHKGINFKNPRMVSLIFHIENKIKVLKQKKCAYPCILANHES